MTNLFRMITLMTLILLFGCGLSTEEIGKTVRASMQQRFDSDPQFKGFGLMVEAVTVVKQGDKFQGIARIMRAGEQHDVPIEIAADGKNVMWQAQPAAFMFLAQAQMQNINNEVSDNAVKQYQMSVRNGNPIEICFQASMVATAYLQANDEPNYKRWKEIERGDCARAGIPK